MKSLILVIHNIKRYIVNRDKYFFIIIVSTIVVTVGMMLVQGYYFEHTYNGAYKTKMNILLNETNTRERVINLVKDLVVNHDKEIYSLGLFSSKKITVTTPVLRTGESLCVVGAFSEKYTEKRVSGDIFTLNSEYDCLLLGMASISRINLSGINSLFEERFTIGDDTYSVSGVTSGTGPDIVAVIPPLVYASKYPTDVIEICLFDSRKKIKKSTLITRLNDSGLVQSIEYTDYTNPFTNNSSAATYIAVYLMFIVFLINALMLLFFRMKKSKQSMIIYRMVGATKVKVFLVAFLELTVMYLCSSLFGYGIFALLAMLIKESRVIYTDSATPYIYLISYVFGGLLVFSAIAAGMVTKKEELYRSAE